MRERSRIVVDVFEGEEKKNYNNLLNLRFDEWREKKVNHVSTKKKK